MMSENKQYVAPISEEAIAAMRRKSAASLPDDPSAAGMKANDIKKRFWSPVLGDTHSLFAELGRVIGEINAALGDQTGISDEQAAAIAELDNLLIELQGKAVLLQEQTETLGTDAAELEQKTQELAAAAEALEERLGTLEREQTIDHRDMTHRDAVGAHPMSAIEGLLDAIAEIEGAISSAVSGHNTDAAAHGDIRLLITGLSDRLNAIANSDDVTLDDFKEIVAYIKANKELIDSITASKVSVSDIVNDLATNAADKPLSAAQGVVLKGLIDEKQGTSGEAPTFDLIALGMQTIGVDAGFVGISCDTTEMRAALDKGAVQFKVKLGELSGEGEYEATILMGSIETETEGSKFTCSCRVSGSYVLDGELSTSNVAELTIVVIEGGVMAVMSHLLHVPPVDETSNGKILQVVDGKWKTADAPSGGGTDIVVDDALSETSENPVQNKVITQVVTEAGTAMAQLGTAVETLDTRVPPVDETSNGKMLQVVDGAWTAVTVADSSIKTYIDDYINEALGGDY